MGNRAGLTLVFLVLLAFACPASADDGAVKEPATGLSFAKAGPDGMALLGVGVRKKMVFNVYAAALYVDAAALAKEVGDDRKPDRVNRAVWTSGLPRVMLMHFVRDVPSDKVKEAFRESLVNNMTADDYAAEKEGIDAFLEGVSDVRKGEIFTFRTSGQKVVVLQNGKKLFDRSSRRRVGGMWGSWFGSRPVCPTLKKDLISRAAEVLEK